MPNKAVSIIIPTYNESANITSLVERIDQAMPGRNYEIFFIDDNSSDGTAAMAEALSSRYPVRVVVRKDKRGLASAVMDGFVYAKNELLVVMDADLQHPPEVIPLLMKAVNEGADLAIASRYVAGGGCQGWSLTRRVISKGAVFLAHLLLPSTRPVKDPMSGFFILERQVVAGANLMPTGYKILLEILVQGKPRNVAEAAYTFQTRTRGESKLNARQQVAYLKHIYSLMKRQGELLRFARFCLVGLSGVLVNMGLLWLLTTFAGFYYLVSSAVAIETAVISNFLLNDRFTFSDRRTPGIAAFSRRLLKFNLVSLAGVAINMGALWLLTEAFGVYYLFSNLCGIALATLWNYLVNNRWTWSR